MKKSNRVISFLLPVIIVVSFLLAALPVSAGGGALVDDKIQIFVGAPVEGESLADAKYCPVLVNSPNCSIHTYIWENMSDFRMMEAGDQVEYGKTYRLTITLVPEGSYSGFDPTSTRILVNGFDPYDVGYEYPFVPGSMLVAAVFVGEGSAWYPLIKTEDIIDLTGGSLTRPVPEFEAFQATMSALEYAGFINIQADDERIAYDINKDGYIDVVLYNYDSNGYMLMEVQDNAGLNGDRAFELNPAAYEYLKTARAFCYAESVRFLFAKAEPEVQVKTLPFNDIKENDVFFNAVYWAFFSDPQVTNGVTEDRFGPYNIVTRGQAVTFLWRALGCPNPAGDPAKSKFVDLTADYYRTAIQWAVEEGITKGVDSTHFRPDGTLSLAHMVTFLYRTLGIGQDGWYKEAADWALGINLTEDISYTVDPGIECPRYATVMMLWRTVGGCQMPGTESGILDESALFGLLEVTAGEIWQKYGELSFEYSDHGPGAPVYSIAGLPGVMVQFAFDSINGSLGYDMVPRAVMISGEYGSPVFGATVSGDIMYATDFPWTEAAYSVMDEVLYVSGAVGPYYVTCLVDGSGLNPPAEEASASEWNTWYLQYLAAPHGKIIGIRLSSPQA